MYQQISKWASGANRFLRTSLQRLEAEQKTLYDITGPLADAIDCCMRHIDRLESHINEFAAAFESPSRRSRHQAAFRAACNEKRLARYKADLNETRARLSLVVQQSMMFVSIVVVQRVWTQVIKLTTNLFAKGILLKSRICGADLRLVIA